MRCHLLSGVNLFNWLKTENLFSMPVDPVFTLLPTHLSNSRNAQSANIPHCAIQSSTLNLQPLNFNPILPYSSTSLLNLTLIIPHSTVALCRYSCTIFVPQLF